MPRIVWPHHCHRPIIELTLLQSLGGALLNRRLVADSGAGRSNASFELLLDEHDCLMCGGVSVRDVTLGGAYTGTYPVYAIDVRIAALGFDQSVPVVGVPSPPAGFDGIACFRFLNRFTFGNFADQSGFGLEI